MEIKEWVDSYGLNNVIYLGDSVYAGLDNSGGFWLVTWNGYPNDPSNMIYIEPEVFEALNKWQNQWKTE